MNDKKIKRAIITGGTGFIGSWLADELLNNHAEVTLLVRNPDKVLEHLKKRTSVIAYRPEDHESMEIARCLSGSYDVFYHLAWDGVSSEKKHAMELQLKNITLSVNAMKLADKIGCSRFIGTGTVAEYVFSQNILDVNAKQTPNDMYGAAKVATYYILNELSKQLSMPFIWALLPSTFGERRNDNNIITYTVTSLLKGITPCYGDLMQMWDFLYISEVVRALRLIGEMGIDGKTYGIGSGVYKPLRDYIVRIRDIINPELSLGIGDIPQYSSQTFSSCVNIYELVKDTGFSPEIDFDTGIRRTIKYWKEKENSEGTD